MEEQISDTNEVGVGLATRLATLKESEPGLRARDLARRLQVSEAELLAARIGEGVVRLDEDWHALVNALPDLGRVMALTRNEHAVHEKHGTYSDIRLMKAHGLVLDPEIDLRLFFNRWAFAFAVEEEVKSGLRRSLQVFDRTGTAVHKVYTAPDSDPALFWRVVERLKAQDQTPAIAVREAYREKPDLPDYEIDVESLRTGWDDLKDTHDFRPLLQTHRVGRLQALRLTGPGYASSLPEGASRRALQLAAERQVPIMIFVGSQGVIQIHGGPITNLRETGAWYNVLDAGFNLHLHESGIASTWQVRKPTSDGRVTSIEAYDSEGHQIVQMFGVRKPGVPEREDWRQLVADLMEEMSA
ncbi:hemin-degrading factor [Fodinicurvata fenggangensis]|uniref:hemin-degrading factor n=1 Tax=Fodinicurvata fenggangensis TaxID=1121830 RepID=UPI0009DED677|nr:ChuX/HutX family heme-like substrate-binding protein [Fodinicurvata fenggangensis]